jgi:tol-pal system protein YbgF
MRLRLGALAALATSAAALSGLASLAGCARDAEERQLDEMRNEIDRIQADRDEADRATLPSEAADTPHGHGSGAGRAALPGWSQPGPGAPVLTPPQPRTLGETGAPAGASADTTPSGGDEDYEDTEDPSPRPTFRMTGTARGTRAGAEPGGSWGESEGASAVTSALDPEAKHAYDAALSLVTSKQCGKALDAFAAFLVKWPDHPYADNAMFWRGECYYQAGDYAHAAEQLDGLLAWFPAGNKAPDALLKLGMAEEKLGNAAKAKECFDRLLQLYPQSDAARRIPSSARAATPRGPAPEDQR